LGFPAMPIRDLKRFLHCSCSNEAARAIPFRRTTELQVEYWPPSSQSEPRGLTESLKQREREREREREKKGGKEAALDLKLSLLLGFSTKC
jgi:hypothetical protein